MMCHPQDDVWANERVTRRARHADKGGGWDGCSTLHHVVPCIAADTAPGSFFIYETRPISLVVVCGTSLVSMGVSDRRFVRGEEHGQADAEI